MTKQKATETLAKESPGNLAIKRISDVFQNITKNSLKQQTHKNVDKTSRTGLLFTTEEGLFIYLFIILVVLGLEPGAPHTLGKHPATELLESKIFSKGDRSCENRLDVGSAIREIRPKSNEMTTRCPSHLQMRKGVLKPR